MNHLYQFASKSVPSFSRYHVHIGKNNELTNEQSEHNPVWPAGDIVRYGIEGFNIPLDTLYVISETILQVK